LFLLATLLDRKRGQNLFYLVIIAHGTVDDTRGLLVVKGRSVFEPALKSMTIGTDQIKSDHRMGRSPLQNNYQFTLSFYHITASFAIYLFVSVGPQSPPGWKLLTGLASNRRPGT